MASGPPAHLSRYSVLVHGFTGAGTSWHPDITRGLEAKGVRAVTPVLPGHGPPPLRSSGAIRLGDALQVLDAAIQKATNAGGAPAVLVGYSMGGRLALHYAQRHPSRIGGLVLESASPGLADEGARMARVEADGRLAARIRSIGIERFADEWGQQALFATQSGLTDAIRGEVDRQRRGADADGLASALEGLGTGALPSLWDDMTRIEVPTLIIAGELDPKFTRIGSEMRKRLPECDFEIVRGAGHRVHLEKPEAWLNAVSTFMERLPG